MEQPLIAAGQAHGPPHLLVVGIVAIGIVAWLVSRAVTRRTRSKASFTNDLGSTGANPERSVAPSRADVPRPPCAPSQPRVSDAVVSVRRLTKRYGELAAVDNLTFSLRRGTITGFLGPNGAGKTTTLRLLLGLAEPTSGEAFVFGRRYRQLADPAGDVGAVLESTDFDPGRCGRDHLLALALAAQIPPGRVDEVLELVELTADRRVKTYSLGMRQRLGLAAALLGDPALLVLDEPTNGLDPVGVRWLRSFLRRFADQDGTVLVSSHLLAEVAQAVDHVIIIDRGQLIADATLAELTGDGRTLEDVYLGLTVRRAS